MKDELLADEEEVQSFGYKRFGIQEGPECTKCKNDWALRAAIALLYVLCALLTIAVALLGHKVVQRVDNVTEEMQNYGGKITAVETDLKKLDDQTGEKADNASSDISTFKSDIQTLQSQLDNVSQRASTNHAVLNQLQVTGEDMQSSQASLQSLLDGSTASLHSVNTTLASYGGIIGGLQTDSTRLQDGLQRQVQEQGQTQVDISSLNRTQAQRGRLLSALQRSVEDAGQAVQRLKNNFHGLQQTARQTQADTDWLREKVQNLQVLTANNSALAQSNGEVLEDMGLQLNTLINQIKNTSFLTEGHKQSLRLFEDQQKDHENTTSSRFDEMEARLDSHEGDINRVTGNFSFANQLLGIISSELNSLRTCAETVTHHSDLLLGLNGSVAEVQGAGLELRAQQDELTDRLDREVNSLSVFMEEMKMVDRKQSQLITNFTILQGPPGPRGARGDKGLQGPIGQQGQKGERGDKGVAGLQGPKGEKGSDGPPGVAGLKGHPGALGSLGPKGYRGSGGRLGTSGEKGEPGAQGLVGRDGQAGPQGAQGPQGARGQDGSSGTEGPRGLVGPIGPKGPPGLPGLPFQVVIPPVVTNSPIMVQAPRMEPDQPGQPEEPDQPGQPGEPDQPGQPGEPDQPGQPGQPDQPGQPGEPDQPEQPGEPDQPGQPGEADQPEQPEEPDQPGQPKESVVPAVEPKASVSQQVQPSRSTTPAPGCPSHWSGFSSRCYFFSSGLQRLNFDEAHDFCSNMTSSMIIVRDLEEQQWVRKQIAGKGYFWLGLTDREDENVWKWVDGTLPVFTKWKPGQPDNWSHGHEEGEDCAGLIHEANWNDFFCTDRIGFICQRAYALKSPGL
ncbi:collectin-12 isoform X1 [Salmo trutta]|uniref:Collectin-12 n=1 Tax=Salmo trutta TaxID=8032 RepID=A0A673WXW1_SALTR|nr:collectin-12-like isoform X1 [Salmo trutta]